MSYSHDELAAMVTRAGFNPHGFVNRRQAEALLAALGLSMKASTQAKIACTSPADAPPYEIIFGRAMSRPVPLLQWAFSRKRAPKGTRNTGRPSFENVAAAAA